MCISSLHEQLLTLNAVYWVYSLMWLMQFTITRLFEGNRTKGDDKVLQISGMTLKAIH